LHWARKSWKTSQGGKIQERNNVVEGIDMKNNSYKAWRLFSKLNNSKMVKQHDRKNVKPNDITRLLILSGKNEKPIFKYNDQKKIR